MVEPSELMDCYILSLEFDTLSGASAVPLSPTHYVVFFVLLRVLTDLFHPFGAHIRSL